MLAATPPVVLAIAVRRLLLADASKFGLLGEGETPPDDDASPDPRALARRLVASLPARGTREPAAEAARENKFAEEKADGDGDDFEPFVSPRCPTRFMR